MATFPTPPADGSGGYAEILVSDTVDAHKIRIHVAPFGATSPYTYSTSHGSDTVVNDTLQAFMDILRAGWDNTWNMLVVSLVRNASGVLTPMFPLPAAAQSGNNGLAAVSADDVARATVNSFTMRTTNPGGNTKYVLRLPSWGSHYTNVSSGVHTTGDIPQAAVLDAPNSAGTIYEKLVAYVQATNGLVAHDGFKPSGVAKNAVTENRRLRRRYGFA